LLANHANAGNAITCEEQSGPKTKAVTTVDMRVVDSWMTLALIASSQWKIV
jgi:hypothetical protein